MATLLGQTIFTSELTAQTSVTTPMTRAICGVELRRLRAARGPRRQKGDEDRIRLRQATTTSNHDPRAEKENSDSDRYEDQVRTTPRRRTAP